MEPLIPLHKNSNMAAPSKMTLKLLINKKSNKVLFAEAGKDAVDFLCNILTLPVGTVINLLSDQQGMAGSLPILYKSIQNLNDTKTLVHNPITHSLTESLFLFNRSPEKKPAIKKLYRCTNVKSCFIHHYVTDVRGTKCSWCSDSMTADDVTFVEGVEAAGGGGFVNGEVTYMVMDDLMVAPMFTSTGITLLKKMDIKDVGEIVEKVVDLDIAMGLKLLRASFQSKNVLTEVFLEDS